MSIVSKRKEDKVKEKIAKGLFKMGKQEEVVELTKEVQTFSKKKSFKQPKRRGSELSVGVGSIKAKKSKSGDSKSRVGRKGTESVMLSSLLASVSGTAAAGGDRSPKP